MNTGLSINLLPAENGDCIHLRFWSKDRWYNVIVDSGPATAAGVFRSLLEKIRSRGEAVDLLCFSHIDDDHIKAAEKVLGSVRFDTSLIRMIWMNLPDHIAEEKETAGRYRLATVTNALKLWTTICTDNIPCDASVKVGTVMELGEMKIEVVFPTEKRLAKYWEKWEKEADEKKLYKTQSASRTDGNPYNGASLVLLCTFREERILLTGDACADDLRQIRTEPLTLVKLPHHGSQANISMEMLEALQCQRFLISTKPVNNRPSPDTIHMLDEYGAKTSDVVVYGNYEWPKLRAEYEYVRIHLLKDEEHAEVIGGIRVFSEKQK